MLSRHGTLSLSRTMANEDEVVLVAAVRWHGMRAEGGYHEIDSRKALWLLENPDRQRRMEMRYFIAEAPLGNFAIHRMADHEVLKLIGDAIRDGRLLVIQKGAAKSDNPSATAELRRLIAQLEKQTRGKLFHRGRQYKLVVDVDLAKTPGRDYYEIASQAEARAVLDGAAKELGAPTEPLKQASEKLSRDWHGPSSHPEGLVLLRRIPVHATVPKDDGPAITPSQMRALLDAEKPVTFFARFVDEHGKGVSGFAGTLAHGSDPDSDLAFSGSGFAKVTLKGKTQAWLTLPDSATKTLVAALKKRWQEFRGEVDEAWKAKEEVLTEIVLQKDTPPEVELQDGKKHTLMLRPPVAMARLHGMYFDTNKCFLLPTATPSLKKLVDLYKLYSDSEILVVAHTDTSGSESHNSPLSADRADSMRAYLRNDVRAWLAWYDKGVSDAKRWGNREDVMMIDSVVREEDFAEHSRVNAYQAWHNRETSNARDPDQPRAKPDGWEELKVDGIMGPKTRRQLVLDYMNLAGTTLPSDTRVVTYGCGEYFPLTEAEGDIDPDAEDGKHVAFDRRVEIFFFRKPFGILPAVPGVAQGESNDKAVVAEKSSDLYPEWRCRSSHDHIIEPGEAAPAVVVEWPDDLSDTLPDDLAIELVADDVAQTIPWSEGKVVDGYRRFVFDADPSENTYTLVAHVGDDRLLLWDDVTLDDPENPPEWENLLDDLSQEPEPDSTTAESEPEEQAVSDGGLGDSAQEPEPDSTTEPEPMEQPVSEPLKIPDGDLATEDRPLWANTLHAIDDLC